MAMCSPRFALLLLLALGVVQLLAAARVPRQAEEEDDETTQTPDEEVQPVGEEEKKSEDTKKSKPEEKTKDNGYTNRFDNIDLDQILKSKRLVNNYYKCLMDQGPCTPDAAELKRVLPDALESDCSKCTEKQREGSDRVIEHIIRNEPEKWKQLQAKFDPENKYESKLKTFVKEHNIEV
ncbi:hypothetical protein B566_EDAN014483 [Ephemera danica]|nr:hypothetical protein B566_EDAN014483 [Ephemera danica]